MMKSLLFILFSLSLTARAQTLNDTFSTQTQLTDDERKEAGEFVHEGLSQRKAQEGCTERSDTGQAGDLKNCDINRVKETGTVLHPFVDESIGKLYAAFFGGAGLIPGMGGGSGPQLNTTDGKQTTDICMYIAVGYEFLSMMMQQSLQSSGSEGSNEEKDPQRKALIALKEAHKARSETADIQALVYGGVATCYILQIAASSVGISTVAIDPRENAMMYVKMGVAGGLAYLFHLKSEKHLSAMTKIDEVIASLPQAGDCNPYTGTLCFCSEPSSKTIYPTQYQKVCVLNNGNFDQPIDDVGCAAQNGSQLAFDKECKCKQTNSCFKGRLTAYNPKFDIGGNLMKQANASFDFASGGQFDRAKIAQLHGANMSMIAQAKKKLRPPKLPSPSLTSDQKKLASALATIMPSDIAQLAAAQKPYSPPGSAPLDGGTKAAIAKLPDDMKKKVDAAKIETTYESGGDGFDSAGNKEEGFALPTFGQQAKSESTEIVRFAEKAINNADINKDKDVPIWDVLSSRYRKSGWNKVEAQDLK